MRLASLSGYLIPLGVRAVLTAVVFVTIWALLYLLQISIVSPEAAQALIAEKLDWLKVLNPEVGAFILDQWQFSLAAVLTLGFLPFSGKPAHAIADIFLRKARLSLSLPALHLVDDAPERLWFLPSESLPLLPILSNDGYAPIKIDRLKLIPGVYQNVGAAEVIVPFLDIQSSEPNDAGLNWTLESERQCELTGPIELAPGETLDLPSIQFGGFEDLSGADAEVAFLMGNANLSLRLPLTVSVGARSYELKLSAPLRVLLTIDEGGDGGVDKLVQALESKAGKALPAVRAAYVKARREEFEMRKIVADRLTDVLRQAGTPDNVGALALLQQRVAARPDDPDAHYALGHALLEIGNADQAHSHVDEAIRLGLHNAAVLIDTGHILAQQSDGPGAVRQFAAALELEPDNVEALLAKGNEHQLTEEYDEAERAYTRVIELRPDEAQAHWGRATARHWQGKTNEALTDFGKAVELDDDVGDALYVAYALSLFDAGDSAKAFQQIGEALKRGLVDEAVLKELAENLEGEDLQRYLEMLDAYGVAYAGGLSLSDMTIDHINKQANKSKRTD